MLVMVVVKVARLLIRIITEVVAVLAVTLEMVVIAGLTTKLDLQEAGVEVVLVV
tara:strand:+ start:275 stop:436 length:162 start_codon:yes stop_codon:yes gene_type:complete